ncbi:hypothetical protein HPP92_001860 [Vanilla planifolia]|uniref:Phosphoribosylglycinamide synthetase N-terminal domain-containing protein n=1 Tax=Vanilla planifolia TaxID=51239 RepID=A0A835VDY6_VANPL|nr:hypothetical protein HPP92_001860 [Vanilla planifolia]
MAAARAYSSSRFRLGLTRKGVLEFRDYSIKSRLLYMRLWFGLHLSCFWALGLSVVVGPVMKFLELKSCACLELGVVISGEVSLYVIFSRAGPILAGCELLVLLEFIDLGLVVIAVSLASQVSKCEVDESTPDHLTVHHMPLHPDTVLEVNGRRSSIYSDFVSSYLRRDRVDKRTEEATFFLKGKYHKGLDMGLPTVEVFIAGCFSGTPTILTKTIKLGSSKKNQKLALDSIPEYDTTEHKKNVSSIGSLELSDYHDYKLEHDDIDYSSLYSRAEYTEDEDGELSWFNAGVRVGVGISLGVCLGVGLGLGLLLHGFYYRSYWNLLKVVKPSNCTFEEGWPNCFQKFSSSSFSLKCFFKSSNIGMLQQSSSINIITRASRRNVGVSDECVNTGSVRAEISERVVALVIGGGGREHALCYALQRFND